MTAPDCVGPLLLLVRVSKEFPNEWFNWKPVYTNQIIYIVYVNGLLRKGEQVGVTFPPIRRPDMTPVYCVIVYIYIRCLEERFPLYFLFVFTFIVH